MLRLAISERFLARFAFQLSKNQTKYSTTEHYFAYVQYFGKPSILPQHFTTQIASTQIYLDYIIARANMSETNQSAKKADVADSKSSIQKKKYLTLTGKSSEAREKLMVRIVKK